MAPKIIGLKYLDLDTLWFAKLPPSFPTPKMRELEFVTADCRWEQWGEERTFIGAFQWLEDMSVTKFKITWRSEAPKGTYKCEQKWVSPPPPLTDDQLELAEKWYGQHIVGWCMSKLGTTVGDGECWSLADQALKSAAPHMIRQHLDPPMSSRGREHGQCILEYNPSELMPTEGLLKMAKVQPGDILRLNDSHFKAVRYHRAFNLRTETNVRMQHHTAVIVALQGDRMKVIEQNGSVENRVAESNFKLADMQAGTVRIFRPVGESCCLNITGMCDLDKW